MKLAERLAQKYRISGMILPLDSIVDEALEEAAKVADTASRHGVECECVKCKHSRGIGTAIRSLKSGR